MSKNALLIKIRVIRKFVNAKGKSLDNAYARFAIMYPNVFVILVALVRPSLVFTRSASNVTNVSLIGICCLFASQSCNRADIFSHHLQQKNLVNFLICFKNCHWRPCEKDLVAWEREFYGKEERGKKKEATFSFCV